MRDRRLNLAMLERWKLPGGEVDCASGVLRVGVGYCSYLIPASHLQNTNTTKDRQRRRDRVRREPKHIRLKQAIRSKAVVRIAMTGLSVLSSLIYRLRSSIIMIVIPSTQVCAAAGCFALLLLLLHLVLLPSPAHGKTGDQTRQCTVPKRRIQVRPSTQLCMP